MITRIVVSFVALTFISGSMTNAQELRPQNSPVDSSEISKTLEQVGDSDVEAAVPKVVELIQKRYQIHPSDWWARETILATKETICLHRPQIFQLGTANSLVYKIESDRRDSDRTIIIDNGTKQVSVDSGLLESLNSSGQPATGYHAWFVGDEVLLVQHVRSPLTSVCLLDPNGKQKWKSQVVTYSKALSRLESLDSMSVELVAATEHVAFFIAGRSEQSVFVMNLRDGKVDFWWSTELYQPLNQLSRVPKENAEEVEQVIRGALESRIFPK